MTDQWQSRSSADGNEGKLPAGLIASCVLAIAASISLTAYYCHSMSGGMSMPGGWTMSMMWMRMPGQSWLEWGAMFMLMWLAMMAGMMLPSAVPMLLDVRRELGARRNARAGISLALVQGGYFAVWQVVGAALLVLGAIFAWATMRWAFLSRTVPILSGATLVASGCLQFSSWKLSVLRRCRDSQACPAADVCAGMHHAWRYGVRQGMACALCCVGPMLAMVALGAMNPVVMVVITFIIAAEKLLPRPEAIVRIFGIVAILAGLTMLICALFNL